MFSIYNIIKLEIKTRKKFRISKYLKIDPAINLIHQSHSWASIQRKPWLAKHMYSDVHFSTICNSQDMETTEISIDRGVDQEDVVHTHNGILTIKKKEIPAFFCNMDGPRNYHAKWSQPYNETPTSNAFTDMWNLKKGQTELLCRTDADSQTLKNLWSPEETVWGVGGCAWAVGWKSCEIRLLWSLYNHRCDKFIWLIKKN